MGVPDASVGDTVIREFAGGGGGRIELVVTAIVGDTIHCGAWTFDRETGAEIDDELCWGPAYGQTGTFLVGLKKMKIERDSIDGGEAP